MSTEGLEGFSKDVFASLSIHPTSPPLRVDESGAIRIGRSRVGLEVVVEQFENGMTPEDLVRAYDTLELADVYAAVSYYLRNKAAVHQYLARRREEADALRAKIESERPRVKADDLLSRRGS